MNVTFKETLASYSGFRVLISKIGKIIVPTYRGGQGLNEVMHMKVLNPTI